MSFNNPHNLEKWAFLWSELRLLIAALALLLGGVPPVYLLLGGVPMLTSIVSLGLTICWIISGVAAAYLLYRWLKHGQMLFGHKTTKDMVAFLVLAVSGLNLGFTGLLGQNIGMSIMSGKIVFLIAGLIYIWAAYHLWNKYKAHGKKLF